MTEVTGLPLDEALGLLSSGEQPNVRIVETRGRRAPEDGVKRVLRVSGDEWLVAVFPKPKEADV